MQGQGVDITIAGDGNSVTVNDAVTADNKKCGDVWGKLFGSLASVDETTFEHTERMFQHDQVPDIDETVDLGGGSQ